MNRIRVLLVDDAVVVRRILSDILAEDAEIEVVGTAAHGRLGLHKIEQLRPDVVVLDIEMPEMDGLTALREIRKRWPTLPVIIFSTQTERGAVKTIEALAAGATDYVTKPANVGSAMEAIRRVRGDLVPKLKVACGRPPSMSLVPPPRNGSGGTGSSPVTRVQRSHPVEIVAIAASTGGPRALETVLTSLPADLPVPIVIVQHMPPLFTRFLAERLAGLCKIDVRESQAGDRLKAGVALIAPGDYHMVVSRAEGGSVSLNQDPPRHSCRPAADVLFESVASLWGPRSLCVVLTGMGRDGHHGAEQIRRAGGRVLAQDEATSVVWGMPGFVVRGNLAERVLPIQEVGSAILQIVRAGHSARTIPRMEPPS